MARFLWMRIKGFLPFEEEQYVNLADVGLTRIEGVNNDDESARSNGSGKSAVIDGLYWTLYGFTTHEESAEGDDVIHLHGDGRNCLGQVSFEKDGREYLVRRGRACTGDTKRLLSKTSGLALECDGEPITLGTIKATQNKLNGILGMTHSTFQHCVLFGQSKAYRFAKLTDKEAKAVFDDMLGVELYAKAGELAGKHIRDLKDTMTQTETLIGAHQDALEYAESLIEEYAVQEATSAEEHAAKVLGLQEIADELLADYDSDLGTDPEGLLVRALGDAKRALEALDQKFSHEVEVQMAVKAKKELLDEQWHNAVEASHEARELGEGSCRTCGADVTDSSKDAYVHVLELEASDLDRKFKKVVKKLKACAPSVIAAKSKQRAGRCTVTEAQRAFDNLKAQRRLAKEQAKAIDAAQVAIDKLKREKTSPYGELTLTATTKALHQRLLRDKYWTRQEDNAVEMASLGFWRDAYNAKGLRSLMVDSVLPYLNARAEEYSNTITAGNIRIEFRTQKLNKGGELREEMHVHVENVNGANTYNLNSVGERAKIDLVVGLALQDMAISKSKAHVNIAFFDEPFDGLDDVAMDRVVDLLSNVLRKRESVFVITHEPSLQAYIPQALTVTKKNKKSTIK